MVAYFTKLFLMNIVRVGFIYFRNGKNLKMVAIALFKNEQCKKFLYNKEMFEEFMLKEHNNLNQVPEYISESITGCSESMWNNFYTQISSNNFLYFSKTQDYDIESFKKNTQDMLPYLQKLIKNDSFS